MRNIIIYSLRGLIIGVLAIGALLVLFNSIKPSRSQEAPMPQCYSYDFVADELGEKYSVDGTSWFYNEMQAEAMVEELTVLTGQNPLTFDPVGLMFSDFGSVVILSFAKGSQECFQKPYYFVPTELWNQAVVATQGSPL